MEDRRVRDVLTEKVVVVRPDTGYKQLVDVLAAFRVSALPVVDEDFRVIGVVSEADLLRKVEYRGLDPHRRLIERPSRRVARTKAAGETAAELMTSPAITITPDASLGDAARLMESAGVKRLPVVTGDGRLVGIVARSDLLRVYLRPDDKIKHEVEEAVLRRAMWLDPAEIIVAVEQGRVTLTGRMDRRTTAQIAVRLVGAVEGVVHVVDELTWDRDDTADSRAHFVFDADMRATHDSTYR